MANSAVMQPYRRESLEDGEHEDVFRRGIHDDDRSPGGQNREHQGIWNRFRSSIRGKDKKQTKQCQECIQRASLLEQFVMERDTERRVIAGMLEKNPYYGGNLQLGDNNEQYIIHGDPRETVEALSDFMHTLTAKVDENIEERTNVEKSLRESKMLLAEMNDRLLHIKARIELDGNNLSKVKTMVESLTDDMSDSHVITSGMEALIRYTVSGRMYSGMDNLPLAAQRAVTRIVNKYDMKWPVFAHQLDVNTASVKHLGADMPPMLCTEICVHILFQWIKASPDHTPQLMLAKLEAMDEARTEEAILERKGKAFRLKKASPTPASAASSDVTDERLTRSIGNLSVETMGGKLSRFASDNFKDTRDNKAHILLLSDVVMEILHKVDDIHARLPVYADNPPLSTIDEQQYDSKTYVLNKEQFV